MFLTDALRLKPGMVVAFVGAGGKSSAMACLVREGAQRHPVVLTTTTRIGREQSSLAATHLVLERRSDLNRFDDPLGAVGGLLVTSGLVEDATKWSGPDDDLLDEVNHRVRRAGGILAIEADGARGKSLKVPAPHEPRIPAFVDVVCPIVGIDALGTTLEGDKVHRAEDLGRFLEIGSSAPIEITHIVKVLGSPEGSLRGVPSSAVVRPLINKVADSTAVERAGLIARGALESGRIQSVLAGAMLSPDAVVRTWTRVAGVVLAAGGATRLSQPKPVLTFRGRPLVRHAVEVAQEAGLRKPIVVLGHAGDAVRRALEGMEVTFVENPEWEQGQSTSLRRGLSALGPEIEGVVFFLADMPFVSAATVRRILDLHSESLSSILVPAADGRRGNPALFDRRTFTALEAVRGDQGGRAIFGRFDVAEVVCEARELMDVDDPEDVERLRALE
jgi:molybdenum cofactor cytidylyltransferase